MTQSRVAILEQNADYWLLNKPVGVAVQGESGSLLQGLRQSDPGAEYYPVHRLDKGTSGALLVARTKSANQALSMAFQDQLTQKFYLAISDRKPIKKQGSVVGDMKKGRRGTHKLLRSCDNPAHTAFFSYALGNGLRLYLLRLYTGKTHQARVALKAIGAPILGDVDYGGTPSDRLYLHAWQLHFPWQNQTQKAIAPVDSGIHFVHETSQDWLQRLFTMEEIVWPKRRYG